jgi:hypothetical protein
MEYCERSAPDMPKEEISRVIRTDMKRIRARVTASLYGTLFRELVDTRAQPAIPRIFDLIESMGPHDAAFQHAFKAVVGIGGPEVVDHCMKALASWNPRSRHAAMLILRDLGLPETRSLARAHLVDFQNPAVGRVSMSLLRRLRITREDVPAMVQALEQIEEFFLSPPNERPNVGHSDSLGHEIMMGLGSLGPAAQDALPILGRITTNPQFPVVAQNNAKKAIEKIRGTP